MMATYLPKGTIKVIENDNLFPIFYINDLHFIAYRLNRVSGDYIKLGSYNDISSAQEAREEAMDEQDVYTGINPIIL